MSDNIAIQDLINNPWGEEDGVNGRFHGRSGQISFWRDHYAQERAAGVPGSAEELAQLNEWIANLPAESGQPADAVSPAHYQFPGGVEVQQISGHLTSFGGQALQYIARSTRLDGNNKGNPVEDLKKAQKFIQMEIDRLEANGE